MPGRVELQSTSVSQGDKVFLCAKSAPHVCKVILTCKHQLKSVLSLMFRRPLAKDEEGHLERCSFEMTLVKTPTVVAAGLALCISREPSPTTLEAGQESSHP